MWFKFTKFFASFMWRLWKHWTIHSFLRIWNLFTTLSCILWFLLPERFFTFFSYFYPLRPIPNITSFWGPSWAILNHHVLSLFFASSTSGTSSWMIAIHTCLFLYGKSYGRRGKISTYYLDYESIHGKKIRVRFRKQGMARQVPKALLSLFPHYVKWGQWKYLPPRVK